MTIPTEPIGSIPRPVKLIEAIAQAGDHGDPKLEPLYDEAVRDTIKQFEATGSPVIIDGEQRKYHNFWTYCVHGLHNTAPDGFKIPFSADDTSTTRERAVAKIRARVEGTRLAEEVLGNR
jgi:5-methyltetrahydropteroyltriglutamate--homocysteine methyltransferase